MTLKKIDHKLVLLLSFAGALQGALSLAQVAPTTTPEERSRLAAYGPSAPQDPRLTVYGGVGIGGTASGNESGGVSLPLVAGARFNSGRHQVLGNMQLNISGAFNTRAEGQYTYNIGAPQSLIGSANSDRVQGQPQLIARALGTAGTAPSSSVAHNSLTGDVGVGYLVTGRNRLGSSGTEPSSVRVMSGMVRPRIGAAVGVSSQSPVGSGAQGLLGPSAGLDLQGSIPIVRMGNNILSAEAAASITETVNVLDTDRNMTAGSLSLGAALRSTRSGQAFRGASVGFQYQGQTLGNQNSHFVGLIGTLEFDAHPSLARVVPSQAAPTATENFTPHPANASAIE